MLAFIEFFIKIVSEINILERKKLKSHSPGVLKLDIEEHMFLINIILRWYDDYIDKNWSPCIFYVKHIYIINHEDYIIGKPNIHG